MIDSPTLPLVANLSYVRYHSRRSDRMVAVWLSGSPAELRARIRLYTLRGPGWRIRWSADQLTAFIYCRNEFHSIATITPGRF